MKLAWSTRKSEWLIASLSKIELAEHLRLALEFRISRDTGALQGPKITEEEASAYLVSSEGLKRSGGPPLQIEGLATGRAV